MNTLTGYRVLASDGEAGVVDPHMRTGRIVVDLAPAARAVLVEVDAIARIDHRNHAIHLDRTLHDLDRCPSA